MLIYLDDLAASVGLPPPDTDPAGRAIVIDILVGISRLLHGDWEVIRALARDERRTAEVFPTF